MLANRTHPSSGRARRHAVALGLFLLALAAGPSRAGEPQPTPTAPPPAADAAPDTGGAQPSPASAKEDAEPFFKGSLTASGWLASVTGYVQTSKGGGAGTTSVDRPTLDEIGIEGLRWSPVVDASAIFLGAHELHINYVGFFLGGTDVLDEDLVSQAVTFPAGSKVESTVDLHMIRIGYRFRGLGFSLAGWTLAPEVGFSINPFSYTLESDTVADNVDRSYTIGLPYLDLLAEGPIYRSLRGEVEVAGFTGINGATLLDLDLRLTYPIVEHKGFFVSTVLGLKGTWFERRDYQSPQYNEVQFIAGSFSSEPWAGLTLGLRIGF